MRRESAMKVFRNILEKSGMKDLVSLSETPNEVADLMVYQKPNEPEYLACGGKPLFKFSEIHNILYQYGDGEEKFYQFVGTELQFIIELRGDASYILEYGENGLCDAMRLHSVWATKIKKFRHCLHNITGMSQTETMCKIWSMLSGECRVKMKAQMKKNRRKSQERSNAIWQKIPGTKSFCLIQRTL